MAWMITHLNPPITIQSCEEDIAVNLIGTLAIQLSVEPGWLLDVIQGALNKAADEHEAAAAEAAKPKPRGRTKKQSAPEPVEEVDSDGADPGQ